MGSNSSERLNNGLTGLTSRRQALKMLGGGLIGGAMAGVGLSVANNTAAQTTTGTAIFDTAGNLLGTVTDLVATLDGAGSIDISGVFTDTAGNITEFTTNLLDASGTCQILELTLGPLDLNLLGLVVHLDQVHLEITAESGPGNLLGNLLCAVAGLLDQGASGNALVRLLNRIFGLLG